MMRLITTVSRVTFQLLCIHLHCPDMCTGSCPIHPISEPQDWAEVPVPTQLPDHSILEQDNQCGQHRTKSKDSKRDTAKRGTKEEVISSTSHWRTDIRQDSKGNRSAKMLARKVWHTQEVAMKKRWPKKPAVGEPPTMIQLQEPFATPETKSAKRKGCLWNPEKVSMVDGKRWSCSYRNRWPNRWLSSTAFWLSVVWNFLCVLTNTTYLESEGKASH